MEILEKTLRYIFLYQVMVISVTVSIVGSFNVLKKEVPIIVFEIAKEATLLPAAIPLLTYKTYQRIYETILYRHSNNTIT